jgi:type 1 glutamine amidotransferase
MKTHFAPIFLLFACLFPMAFAAPARGGQTEPIRVLLVTGGHGFKKEPFLDVFRSFDDVTFRHVVHPKAQAFLRPEALREYDVVVFYDMWQKIDGQGKKDFEALLKAGKGVVVLHHAIASYNDWDRYAEIIGAKYYLKPQTVNGVEKPKSGWKHGVDIKVHVVDPQHPVTRGMKDFTIHDETYKLFDVSEDVTPLLTTAEPTSEKTIGWARTVENSRLVYLQSGHDHSAYENPNYRRLVHQAILWTARRSKRHTGEADPRHARPHPGGRAQ